MRDGYSSFFGQAPSFTCGNVARRRASGVPPLSEGHYLKMYIHMRAVETKKPWSQFKIDSVVRTIMTVYESRGLIIACQRAEAFFKDFENHTKLLTSGNTFGTVVSESTTRSVFQYNTSAPSGGSGGGGTTSGY